jgi:hypothetical protein
MIMGEPNATSFLHSKGRKSLDAVSIPDCVRRTGGNTAVTLPHPGRACYNAYNFGNESNICLILTRGAW